MATNDRFRARFKKRIQKADAKIELFAKRLTVEIYSRVVLKSPVDTGRFRANWQFGNASVNGTTTEATDKGGAGSIAQAAGVIMSTKINGQMLYITNSLSYAARLEYEGWSLQAPQGMVRITLAEMSSITRGVASEVRGF